MQFQPTALFVGTLSTQNSEMLRRKNGLLGSFHGATLAAQQQQEPHTHTNCFGKEILKNLGAKEKGVKVSLSGSMNSGRLLKNQRATS